MLFRAFPLSVRESQKGTAANTMRIVEWVLKDGEGNQTRTGEDGPELKAEPNPPSSSFLPCSQAEGAPPPSETRALSVNTTRRRRRRRRRAG